MTNPASIYEQCAKVAIDKLSVSKAPMNELDPVLGFITSGCPGYYDEERRDSLLSLARHVANKQRERIRDGQMIGRTA
ncbi:hypothetical protein [Ectopseudomonas composti]|uniref:hypothetical protein n=1 Tax=Ectopseudomonas composti TaxID=658457 RepID=UPI00077452FF|nr:hypothetical protein [Pseudomonas composti]